MYVSIAERQDLGGLFSFVLPIAVVGVGAGIAADGAYLGDVPWSNPLLPLIAPVLLSLTFLWQPRSFVLSIAGAISVGVLLAVMQTFEVPWGGLLVSAWLLISIKLALADFFSFRQKGDYSFYSFLFPRLLAVPIVAALAAALSLLFFVMMTAFFQVGVNFDIAESAQESLLSDMQNLPRIVLTAIVGGFFGLVVALVRRQSAMIGAVRYALLWVSRYTFLIVVVIGWASLAASFGSEQYTDLERVGFWQFIAAVTLATFALVYVDGTQEKPGLWLRISLWSALPLVGLALSASWLKWSELDGQALLSTFLLSVLFVGLCGASLFEFFRKGRGWMPLYAYAQTFALILLSLSPLLAGLF